MRPAATGRRGWRQVITNRSKSVAVLVSPEYFRHSEAAVKPLAQSFYSQLMQLRQNYLPQDEAGFAGPKGSTRQKGWQRANAFLNSV